MLDFNKDWKPYRIKDVSIRVGGTGFPETLQGRDFGDIPFYKVSDINGKTKYTVQSKNYVSYKDIESKNWKLISKNCILFSKVGEALKKNHRKILSNNSLIDNNIGGIIFNQNLVDNNYAYYLMKIIDMNWYTNMGAIPAVNMAKFAIQKISLPLIPEQKAIGQFLDKKTSLIDKKLSILESRKKLILELEKSLINQVVTKGLQSFNLDKNGKKIDFNNDSGLSDSEFDTYMKECGYKDSGIEWIGYIPKSFKKKRIKDCFENVGGGKYGKDENELKYNLTCFSISDFKNGDIDTNDNIIAKRSYDFKNILKKGTILVEKSGGGDKNPVGRTVLVRKDIEAYYTNFVVGLLPQGNSIFFQYVLKNIHNRKLHMPYVKQNTGLQNFDYTSFSNYFYIYIPDKRTQKTISNFLDKKTSQFKKQVSNIDKEIELLKEFRETVINDAVTGKTKVIKD